MKRKVHFFKGTLFQYHLILFVVLVLAIVASTIATLNYPGNASVPFSVFRMFIIERLSWVMLLGLTVFIHFIIHQSRQFLKIRAYQNHLDSIQHIMKNPTDYSRLALQDAELDTLGQEDPNLNQHQKKS
jgi:hypothetical protein